MNNVVYCRDLFSQLPVSLSNPDIDLFKFEQLLRGYGQLFKTKMLPEGAASPVNMAKQLFSNIYKVKIYTDMYL